MLHLKELGQLPVSKVSIHLLKDADSPRSSGENLDHAHTLAESEDPLPPIIVCRQTMRVVDGMHRLRAARLCGKKSIDVRFFDGDEASAFVIAVQANIKHGLPLSLSDRKAAAARITSSYPEWSDRMVAAATGLAASTVAAIRGSAGSGHRQADIRVGFDGRARPVNIADRREVARKLMTDKPDASLREIARRAGISPETVRGIRMQLQNDHNSVPLQQFRTRETAGTARNRKRSQARRVGFSRPRLSGSQSLQSIIADPALRSTETGRLLLRLLCTYQIIEENFKKLVEAVPAHCMDRVAGTVCACVRSWQDFAEEIERQRQSTTKRG